MLSILHFSAFINPSGHAQALASSFESLDDFLLTDQVAVVTNGMMQFCVMHVVMQSLYHIIQKQKRSHCETCSLSRQSYIRRSGQN